MKTIIAMSGGVDSSVAACLMKEWDTATFHRIAWSATAQSVEFKEVLIRCLLSQSSLSGMLLPDRLLGIVIGLFTVGIAASIPFSKKLYRAILNVFSTTRAAHLSVHQFHWFVIFYFAGWMCKISILLSIFCQNRFT